MSLLKGRAKKYDGTAIDYVSIFSWTDGKCIGQATPNSSGNWYYYHHADTLVGITYVADGCEPITHGAYTVERNNDLNPEWAVINSTFNTDLVDDAGKIWTAHGNANVNSGALHLDGNGDCINTPFSPDISFHNSEDVTIRFRARVDSFSSGVKLLLMTRKDLPSNQGGIHHWVMFATVGGVSFGMWNGVNGGLLINKTWDDIYTFGTEFELSLERKEMAWRLYINGVQQGASVTQTSNYKYTDGALLNVGSEFKAGGDTGRDLKGSISNLQILKGGALGGGGATTPLIT